MLVVLRRRLDCEEVRSSRRGPSLLSPLKDTPASCRAGGSTRVVLHSPPFLIIHFSLVWTTHKSYICPIVAQIFFLSLPLGGAHWLLFREQSERRTRRDASEVAVTLTPAFFGELVWAAPACSPFFLPSARTIIRVTPLLMATRSVLGPHPVQ